MRWIEERSLIEFGTTDNTGVVQGHCKICNQKIRWSQSPIHLKEIHHINLRMSDTYKKGKLLVRIRQRVIR